MVTLEVYTLEETKEYDTDTEAEQEKEYLERVMGKICTVRK